MQIKNQFDRTTIHKIARGAGIASGGALLTYMATEVGNYNYGIYTPLITATLAILINAVREYRAGYEE